MKMNCGLLEDKYGFSFGPSFSSKKIVIPNFILISSSPPDLKRLELLLCQTQEEGGGGGIF